MSENLERLIQEALGAALKEWSVLYPEYVEIRDRLARLRFAIPSIAQGHALVIPDDVNQQLDEFRFIRTVSPKTPRKDCAVACPTCGVAAGSPCRIIQGKSRGRDITTGTHRRRLLAAQP